MADLDAYTFTPLIDSSTVEWITSVAIDRAENLTAHARAAGTGKKGRFTLSHLLTFSQYASLLALYASNQLLRVTLTWNDGNAYICFFNGAPTKPKYETAGGGMRVRVSTVLEEQ